MTRHTRKGFTLIELLVVISIIALLIGILLPALQRAKRNANALRDGTQLKQIHLAMTTYATSNGDRYPTPTTVDRQGYTEGLEVFNNPGEADPNAWHKNRTGAIFSILVFNGSIVPEICISPQEPNGAIEVDADYHYALGDGESLGVNQAQLASWDPTFMSTPADDDVVREGTWLTGVDTTVTGNSGNFSYAHAPLDGNRGSRQRRYWQNSFRAADPVMSNRGPVYSGDSTPSGMGTQAAPTPTSGTWFLAGNPLNAGERSDTLTIAGSTNEWSGNVVYNDNHVSLENSAQPESVTFTDRTQSDPVSTLDNLFVDEQNETDGGSADARFRSNAYLRLFGDGIDTSQELTEERLFEHIWYDGNSDLGQGAGG